MRSLQPAHSPLPAFVAQRGHTGTSQGSYPGTAACRAAFSPAALSASSPVTCGATQGLTSRPDFQQESECLAAVGADFPGEQGNTEPWEGMRGRNTHPAGRHSSAAPLGAHPAPLLPQAFLPCPAARNFVINTLIRQCTSTVYFVRE